MAEAAMWTAIAAIVTGLLNLAGMMIKNRQQDGRLLQLEAEHKKCDEERKELKTKFNHEWPSDPMEIVNAMNDLKKNGFHPTVAQLAMVLENVKASRQRQRQRANDKFITE